MVLNYLELRDCMRAVFSSFVAVSLLVHAAFGCCWHHVHEAAFGESTLTVESATQHADHAVIGHSHECDPAHSPTKEHSHCQGTCHYLPGQKTQLDKSLPLSTLELVAVAPAVEDVHIAVSSFGELSLDSPAQPPLRLHLFHQILLI